MVRRSCVEVVPSFAWEGQATAKTNAKGATEERNVRTGNGNNERKGREGRTQRIFQDGGAPIWPLCARCNTKVFASLM
jgi:hypothetical protein